MSTTRDAEDMLEEKHYVDIYMESGLWTNQAMQEEMGGANKKRKKYRYLQRLDVKGERTMDKNTWEVSMNLYKGRCFQ